MKILVITDYAQITKIPPEISVSPVLPFSSKVTDDITLFICIITILSSYFFN